MKKFKNFKIRIVVLCFTCISVGIMLMSSSGGRDDNRSGAPPGTTCSSCHSNGGGGGNIVISGVPNPYTPSTMYRITIKVSDVNALVGGYQLVARNSANQNIGTFNTLTGSRFAAQGGVTHSTPRSFSNGMVSWEVDWISPSTSTNITFYAAGIAANGNGNDGSGDDTYSTTLQVSGGASCTPPVVGLTNNGNICRGQSGQISASGGITYLWSNGQTSSTITVSPQSTTNYTVTVTDALGCTATSSISQQVNQPPGLVLTGINPACAGLNNGIVVVDAAGTPNFTYNWNNGQSSNTISNLFPGTYTVTVTDGNGCRSSASKSLVYNSTLNLALTTTQGACNGQGGTVQATATGGTSPYLYTLGQNQNNTGLFNNIAAGTYYVTVSDNIGCRSYKSATITQSSNISLSYVFSPLTCLGAITNLTINASGGQSPYTYDIGNGPQSGSTFFGVSAGSFQVTVTSSNGCQGVITAVIPNGSPVSASITGPSILCPGSVGTLIAPSGYLNYSWNTGSNNSVIQFTSSGTYSVTASNTSGCIAVGSKNVTVVSGANISISNNLNPLCAGSSTTLSIQSPASFIPSTYFWNNGQTTSNLIAVNSGVYSVTVTDANGCVKTSQTTITLNTGLDVNATVVQSTCTYNKGSIFVSPNSPNFIWIWSDAGPLAPSRTDLSPGTYTVTVSVAGNNTCKGSRTFVINDASIPTVGSNTTNAHCGLSNGAINLSPANNNLQFVWENQSGGPNRYNLGVGTYFVTVTNASGCTSSLSANIINEYTPISLNLSASCIPGSNTGNITATTSSTNPGTSISYGLNGLNFGSTYVFSTLSNGGYFVIAREIPTGCETTATTQLNCGCTPIEIQGARTICNSLSTGYQTNQALQGSWTILPIEAGAINASGIFTPSSVYHGNATICFSESPQCTQKLPIFIFGLQLINTSTGTTCGLDNGCLVIQSPNASSSELSFTSGNTTLSVPNCNMSAGNYQIQVIHNATGCHQVVPLNIGTSQPLVLNSNVLNPSCYVNGTIQITANLPISSFNWSDIGQGTATRNDLNPGFYRVTVVASNGCAAVDEFSLDRTNNMAVQIETSGTNVTALVTPSSSQVTYSWSNGSTTSTQSNLPNGNYCVTVTSSQGCISTSCAQVRGTSTLDNELVKSWKLYPNPANKWINIEIELNETLDVEIEIFDYTGNRIMGRKMTNLNHILLPLDLGETPSGLYFIKLKNGSSFFGKSFIVQH
jgi:hypothetical protein